MAPAAEGRGSGEGEEPVSAPEQAAVHEPPVKKARLAPEGAAGDEEKAASDSARVVSAVASSHVECENISSSGVLREETERVVSSVVLGGGSAALKATEGESLSVKEGETGSAPCAGGSETQAGGRKRLKKRKIAMFFAYCGEKYQGMQRNPGAVTIEGILETSLHRAGAIGDDNFGDPRSVDWMRAARTDKGVSAVGQVVSARMVIEPAGFVERVNKELPEDIHLLGFKRVTNGFNAKQLCDRRRYEYVIPTFAFDAEFLKVETVVKGTSENKELRPGDVRPVNADSIASSGSNLELTIKGVEVCEEKHSSGNNAEGALEKVQSEVRAHSEVTVAGEVKESSRDVRMEERGEIGVGERREEGAENRDGLENVEKPKTDVPATEHEGKHNVQPQAGGCGGPIDDVSKGSIEESKGRSTFVFDDEVRARLDKVLSMFEGTHNFHNFTSRVRAEDPSALRYMVSFKTVEIFCEGGIEFVKCHVVGQSFMLHQIRKMIGMAVAVLRGFAPESMIDLAFRRDRKVNTPLAPEVGLFLDECLYTGYNRKFQNSHEEISLDCFREQVDAFKRHVIYPHMAATEKRDQNVRMFLLSLNDQNYPEFALAREQERAANAKQAEAPLVKKAHDAEIIQGQTSVGS